MIIIGIDLGTNNTVLSYYKNGHLHLINKPIPSIISIVDPPDNPTLKYPLHGLCSLIWLYNLYDQLFLISFSPHATVIEHPANKTFVLSLLTGTNESLICGPNSIDCFVKSGAKKSSRDHRRIWKWGHCEAILQGYSKNQTRRLFR